MVGSNSCKIWDDSGSQIGRIFTQESSATPATSAQKASGSVLMAKE